MPQKLDTISRFSPGNCAPELLESILVGRGELADRLERSVRDSIATGAGHHWLLIGPRGAGKTHLLAILYNRIGGDQESRSRVAIAYLKEEERGVASFLDWLVRILRAFRRWHELPADGSEVDLDKDLESLTQLPLDQAQTAAERLLLRFVGDRRLLLLTENLGEIFDDVKGMGREGQQRFRDLVQQHPFWTIVASSQALFEDVQSKDAPFYGFFKTHHLGMFDFNQAVELLENLARQEGRSELREFFGTEVGRGRVKAVHKLTGGNPRLLVIFYQFIDRESIEELAPPFLEMVDSLTSYYQEQMQPLPALQQKIVEFLCEHRVPATVKEIAQSCFVTPQTTSKQLGRLTDRRYVVANKVGRESFYELREPLFRICFEVKENLGYPIRLFVDFLGNFYSLEELMRKYRTANLLRRLYEGGGKIPQTKKIEAELGYLSETLSAYHLVNPEELKLESAPFIRPEPELIGKTIEELFSEQDFREAIKLADAAYELKSGGTELLVRSAVGHAELGDLSGARERLEQFVSSEPKDGKIWGFLAHVQQKIGDAEAARRSYDKAIELAPDTAIVWEARGRFFLGYDHAAAIECFQRVTELCPERGEGWRLLGFTYELLGDLRAAEANIRKSVSIEPEGVEAWTDLARLATERGSPKDARHALNKAEALEPESGWDLSSIGDAYLGLGDYVDAIRLYRQCLEMEPGHCYASFSIALALFESGDLDAGLKQLQTAARTSDIQDWSQPLPICSTISLHLLQHAEADRLGDLLANQLRIWANPPLFGPFLQGLNGALMSILTKQDLPLDRLITLRDRIIPGLAGHEELSVACRLFSTGVSFLETRDPRVLLELPREERQSLEEILEPSKSEEQE